MVVKLLSIAAGGVLLGILPFAGRASPDHPAAAPDRPLIGLSVPSQVATIAGEQSGKIVAVPVSEGDPVGKDQVLFRLSSKLQELEVERLRAPAESDLIRLRAVAGVEHAQKQAARVRELRSRQFSSESDMQDRDYEVSVAQLRLRQAAMEQAQAINELEQAKERLAQRTVRSPFEGLVVQRHKSAGETVEKFVTVLEVIDLDPLWVEFDCPVADERLYTVGTKLTVSPAVRPEDKRTAEIVHTSMRASPSSHTFLVRAAVSNAKHDWKAGLKMVVQRPAPSAKAPQVPEAAPAKPGPAKPGK